MIVINRKHSYFIDKEDIKLLEPGSMVFDTEAKKMYLVLEPGKLAETEVEEDAVQKLQNAINAGGEVAIEEEVDFPKAFVIEKDTTIVNNGTISAKEDTVGDGIFKVNAGTLTLNGAGTINALGNNDYCMAVWAARNGRVVINDGFFTNEGAHSANDSEHFDLIYASGNGVVEINGGEFKCETPKWTLNIKDSDVATAKIIVKGGKFHGFNPSEAPDGNFVADGYKVVEDNGVFTVVEA